MGKLYVEGSVIHVKRQGDIDLVCLTDIAKVANPKNPDKVLYKYMRQKSTVELIILHERPTWTLICQRITSSSCLVTSEALPSH